MFEAQPLERNIEVGLRHSFSYTHRFTFPGGSGAGVNLGMRSRRKLHSVREGPHDDEGIVFGNSRKVMSLTGPIVKSLSTSPDRMIEDRAGCP